MGGGKPTLYVKAYTFFILLPMGISKCISPEPKPNPEENPAAVTPPFTTPCSNKS